jgi:hypothetical protein
MHFFSDGFFRLHPKGAQTVPRLETGPRLDLDHVDDVAKVLDRRFGARCCETIRRGEVKPR